MRISEKLGISVSQYELDFLDVDIEVDNKLFIDPFLIANSNSKFAIDADFTIKSFFNQFKNTMRSGNYNEAFELFRYMSEPKENCLGISTKGTKNGRGVGELNTKKILKNIVDSDAIENDLVKNIEDLVIFVEDIDKDKLSDMVTNIIRLELTKYTQQQCKLWNIRLTEDLTLPYWDVTTCSWVNSKQELLVIDGYEYLLIPKSIVSPLSTYNISKYSNSQIIEQERLFHLQRKSALVRYRHKKDGSIEPYVYKKDVREDVGNIIKERYLSTKDYIRQYTLQYPDLFTRFVNVAKRNIKSLTNVQIAQKLEESSIEEIIDRLIDRLKSIPTGGKDATDFHYFIRSLLAMLWYPHLVNPKVEVEIHEGRKRIDIVMENNASSGFFYNLHAISKIFCPNIFIECKNYGKDVANPEIDQLSGRFGSLRGQFGILVCRELQDYNKFMKRCKDTYLDGRGLVICLTDKEVIDMLNFIKEDCEEQVLELLNQKKQEIVL